MNRRQLTARFAACLACCSCLIAADAAAHPFHVSFAEAEWNAADGRLEVALSVNANDLEQAIRRQLDRPVQIDGEANDEVRAYLVKHFCVRDRANQQVALTWVGYETTAKEAWLYFEIPLAEGGTGIEITNRVLLDDIVDQANTLLVKVGEKPMALEFTAEDPTQTISAWELP